MSTEARQNCAGQSVGTVLTHHEPTAVETVWFAEFRHDRRPRKTLDYLDFSNHQPTKLKTKRDKRKQFLNDRVPLVSSQLLRVLHFF